MGCFWRSSAPAKAAGPSMPGHPGRAIYPLFHGFSHYRPGGSIALLRALQKKIPGALAALPGSDNPGLPPLGSLSAHSISLADRAGRAGLVPNVGLLMLPYTIFQFSLGYSALDIKSFADVAAHPVLLGGALVGFGVPALAALGMLKADPAPPAGPG